MVKLLIFDFFGNFLTHLYYLVNVDSPFTGKVKDFNLFMFYLNYKAKSFFYF